ncbi:MAG: peptidase [Streptosporangiales bacterium]|nr:peptidase [Streptosporangiales bacterium]
MHAVREQRRTGLTAGTVLSPGAQCHHPGTYGESCRASRDNPTLGYARCVRPLPSDRVPGPSSPGRRTRRRDRHGRGLRGPLAPPHVPLVRTRSQRFDDLVLDAVERLEGRWARELAGVEFAVEEVPPGERRTTAWEPDPVPLSRLMPPARGRPPRIVLYRRPLEARATDGEDLGALVHDVVVEEVAQLLGLEPETVDPHYAEGDD